VLSVPTGGNGNLFFTPSLGSTLLQGITGYPTGGPLVQDISTNCIPIPTTRTLISFRFFCMLVANLDPSILPANVFVQAFVYQSPSLTGTLQGPVLTAPLQGNTAGSVAYGSINNVNLLLTAPCALFFSVRSQGAPTATGIQGSSVALHIEALFVES
jgi:hypothetical protein